MAMSDLMISSTGQSCQNYNVTSEEGVTAFNYLKSFFPNEQIEDYSSVTNSYIHEVFNVECIRTCVPNNVCKDMIGIHTVSAHRLFVLNTGESYFLANQLFTDEQPTWKPDRSFVLAVMEPYAEYRNTTPEGFDSFKEYIVAMRPEVATKDLNFSPDNASGSSAYTMLVNTSGTVISARSYSGYSGGSSFETLQSRHVFLCRRNNRIDLARSFRDGNYIDT
jgi:hypothetical protein